MNLFFFVFEIRFNLYPWYKKIIIGFKLLIKKIKLGVEAFGLAMAARYASAEAIQEKEKDSVFVEQRV